MNTIKKIFSGRIDEEVHSEFIKFGRGVFDNRYLIDMKKQKDAWNIKTSAEFANFLVKESLKKVSGSVNASGAVITTLDLKGKLGFDSGIKQFAGIKQYLVNGEVEAVKVLDAMDKYPRAFFALSFSTPEFQLKVKAKAPKSGKPSAKGEGEPKADFCALKTKDAEIVKDLVFDLAQDTKEASIKHVIEVKEIILPKGVENPIELREKSQRKGVVKRIVNISGTKNESEKEFLA